MTYLNKAADVFYLRGRLRFGECVLVAILAWASMVLSNASAIAANEPTVQKLIADIASGSWQSRYSAMSQLYPRIHEGQLRPADLASALDVLARTVKDPNEEDTLRRTAVQDLGAMGTAAASAADAIFDMMMDQKLQEDDARLAAVNWGTLKVMPSQRMLDMLRGADHRLARLVAQALGTAGSPTSTDPLIDTLGLVTDVDDDRYLLLEQALANLDPSAAPRMIERIPGLSPVQKRAVVEAIGSRFFDGPAPSATIVTAIRDLLGPDEDQDVRHFAAETLGLVRAVDPKTVDALLDALAAKGGGWVRGAAAEALAELACGDPRTPTALAQALITINDGAPQVIAALEKCRPAPLDAIEEGLHATSEPLLRARLIEALTKMGFPAARDIPQIVPDIAGSDEQLSAITNGLTNLGPSSLDLVPPMADQLAKETDANRKHMLASALADAARFALGELPADLTRSESELRRAFELGVRLVDDIARLEDDPTYFRSEYLEPLQKAAHSLKMSRWLRWATWSSLAFGTVLLALGVWSSSWRLQRRFRILLGRRWMLMAQPADVLVEIRDTPVAYRVTVRPIGTEALSSILAFDLPTDVWPPSQTMLEKARAAFKPNIRVRIEADRNALHRPWAVAIGDPWSTEAARIAGQICLSSELLPSVPHSWREVAFSGLYCENTVGYPPLPGATPEVRSVGNIFETWGATTHLPERDAIMHDFVAALESSDVVHAAIHAGSEGLVFQDGLFRPEHLPKSQIRCRLLVLSACEAGDVSLPEAFLWSILRQGVNVIAATRPVNDQACRVFFEGFYEALLPKKQFGGIDLATAARAGANACRKRFARAQARLGISSINFEWEPTVDGFLLFGDPTTALRLH